MSREFNYRVRQATPEDFQAIADAHQASILELAPGYYPPDAIAYWGRKRDLDGYRKAANDFNEVFFIAEPHENPGYVYGFSSYRYEDNLHRLQGFYVRGTAARRGIGTALLGAVEHLAVSKGGNELYVEASLSGEAFYKAAGFNELRRRNREMGIEVEVIDMMKPLAYSP